MRPLPVFFVLFAFGCGSSEKDLSLNVTWKFLSGDCTSNAVKTVRVSWGPSGTTPTKVDFACADGQGKLGDLSAMGGSYSVTAEGLDMGGVARFTHFGTTLTVGASGTGGQPVDLTLRPKPSDVVVTWQMANGSGCPSGVQLPYYVAVYRTTTSDGGTVDAGTLGSKVKEVQESCVSKTATVETISPGNYIVEVDSRAITPKVRGTKDVTVVGGENAMVNFQF